jgi:hypothetical protein
MKTTAGPAMRTSGTAMLAGVSEGAREGLLIVYAVGRSVGEDDKAAAGKCANVDCTTNSALATSTLPKALTTRMVMLYVPAE